MDKVFHDNDPHVTIGRTLVHTARRHFQLCELHLDQMGIGPGQMPVLRELARHKKMTQRELAEHAHVTAATISGTLKRMERANLVKRSEDETDARVSIVELTEKGMSCSDEAVARFAEADTSMLEGFSEDEMAQLLGYLQRMHENVCRSLDAAIEASRKDSNK